MATYPKIGIRPTIDGRQGGVREALEEKTMALAHAVADLIEERLKHLSGRVEINYVGNLIGSHTGPGTVALFFWGKERT